ncbi:hypothetical protein MCHI_000253 [Candidatus Magnetoovum chiemensis]|nr:hypothetical protein MCHI_000253 [Candidatus Magnetoovum chiemensis]
MVTASGGWGKSLFILSYLKQSSHSYVWYNLDEADSDRTTFMIHLIHGITSTLKTEQQIQNNLNSMVSPSNWKD